jgi:hypothetical protein
VLSDPGSTTDSTLETSDVLESNDNSKNSSPKGKASRFFRKSTD